MAEESYSSDLTEFWVGGENATPESMNEIAENLSGFFDVLREWERKSCHKESEPVFDTSNGNKLQKVEQIGTGNTISHILEKHATNAVTSGAD